MLGLPYHQREHNIEGKFFVIIVNLMIFMFGQAFVKKYLKF